MDKNGEYQGFPSEYFCPTVPKRFVGESFTVALISGTERVCIRGGGVSRFSVENFSSHSAEIFRGGILYCCINFGNRKGLDKRCGEYHDFPSNNFCLTVPKIFVGEPFSVALISGIEKVWIGRGEYQDFPSENFCLTVLKISLGESFTVALISVSEKVWIRRVGVSRYSVEIFCLTLPKNFVGEPSTVAVISGIEKVWIGRGGGSIKIFHRKNFVSQCQKIT